MKKLFLVATGVFLIQFLSAQVTFPVTSESNHTVSDETHSNYINILNRNNINQDPRLETILKWHIENNKKREGIDGYRVEIFFSSALNAKDMALSRKKDFLMKYPEYDVHVKYTSPNFRVRVGDFRTKNEALKLHKKIEKNYPEAFIVPDIIDFPQLKQKRNE